MAKLTKDYNLAALYPDIAKEWHPTNNGDLTPNKLSHGSKKKVWWLCEKGCEYYSTVSNKVAKNSTCPYCSGHKVGFGNDLQTLYPEIAKEWHPTKNGDMKPNQFTPGSHKKVWWLCEKGCEWETFPYARTKGNNKKGTNCPYCAGQKVGFNNDLAATFPDLLKEWDAEKNKGIDPTKIHPGSHKKVWWICKNGTHSWKTKITLRTRGGYDCPKCSKQTSRPELYFYSEFQSIFKSVHHRKKIEKMEIDIFIEDINLAIEYDGVYFHKSKTKTDKLKKNKIINLGMKCINVREIPLKKILDNDLLIKPTQDIQLTFLELLKEIKQLKILNENHKKDIDNYLNEKQQRNIDLYKKLISYLPGPLPGQSFADKFPHLVKEWNHSKNGALTPYNMHPGNPTQKIWWLCEKGCEWETTCNTRTNKSRKKHTSCPYCSGHKVGFGNDLQTLYPEIAKEWHPTKNGDMKPNQFMPGSGKKVWWICNNTHSWQSTILNRKNGSGCPYCNKYHQNMEKYKT